MKKIMLLLIACGFFTTSFSAPKPSNTAYFFVWDEMESYTTADRCLFNYTVSYSMEFGVIKEVGRHLNWVNCH